MSQIAAIISQVSCLNALIYYVFLFSENNCSRRVDIMGVMSYLSSEVKIYILYQKYLFAERLLGFFIN